MLNDLDLLEGRKRLFVTISVLAILLLTLVDMIFDKAEGVGWAHLLVEAFIILSCFAALLSLWWHTLTLSLNKQTKLEQELDETRTDLTLWRNKTQELLDGLGRAIQEQFMEWSLTSAEQDVALLLLKGLGVKEIAALRETKEKTVRHQAASVYRKARVEGRNDLSAFFLEDLLLPQKIEERVSFNN